MVISPKRIAFFIAIMGGIWAFMVSTHNAQYAKESGNKRYRDGMITTADDASYLRPPENFLRDGVWKDNSQGVSSYIQRPPGLGFIHMVFYGISPHHYAILHRIFTTLLHILAIYILGLTALELAGRKTAVIVQSVYALLPCFWGYLFYYISESITPSLLIFLFYGYVKYHYCASSKWLMLQAFISGLILLTRPQLLIFVFPFLYLLFHFLKGKNVKKTKVLFLSLLLAFGGFISWQVRSTIIAKRFTGLHGIYDVTNKTPFRPVHRAFGELFKIWEYDGETFHAIMSDVWWNAVTFNNKGNSFNPDLINFRGCEGMDKQYLTNCFNRYKQVIQEVQLMETIQAETQQEIKLRKDIESFTWELKKQNLFLCYVKTPFRSAKFMFTKSQLNMGIFQHKYRGLWWMETLRFTCLGIILLSISLTISNVFRRKNIPIFLFALSTVTYLFYLFFIQKMNEERYLMPLLPILLLISAFTLSQWKKYFIKPGVIPN